MINGMINQAIPSYNPPSLKFLAAQKVAEQVNIDTNSLPDELEDYVDFIKKHSEYLKSKHYPSVVMSAAHDNFPDILTDIMKLSKTNYSTKLCALGLSAALSGGDHERCVQILLENGGSAYDKNNSGHLAFHFAALLGRTRCLELLLKDKFVNTPWNVYILHQAVVDAIHKGFSDCLAVLLEYRKDDINWNRIKACLKGLKIEHRFGFPKIANENSDSENNGRITCLEMLAKDGWSSNDLYSKDAIVYDIDSFSKLSSDKCLALECIQEKMLENILNKI